MLAAVVETSRISYENEDESDDARFPVVKAIVMLDPWPILSFAAMAVTEIHLEASAAVEYRMFAVKPSMQK